MESFLAIAARRVRLEMREAPPAVRADMESVLAYAREALELLYQNVAPDLRKANRLSLEDHTYIEKVLREWDRTDYRERGVVRAAIVDYAKEHRAARDLRQLVP